MNLCEICSIKPESEINIHQIYMAEYNLKDIIYELTQIEVNNKMKIAYLVSFVNTFTVLLLLDL